MKKCINIFVLFMNYNYTKTETSQSHLYWQKQYEKYLQSDRWKKLSTQRKVIDDYTCQMCGKTQDECIADGTGELQVHHMRYPDKLGTENVYKDLVTLCPDCHRYVHNMMNRVTGIKPDGTYQYGWHDTIASVAVTERHLGVRVDDKVQDDDAWIDLLL